MTVYDIAARLPSIDVLRSRCRALAALERIHGDGVEPYYDFLEDWDGDHAALMNNGSGDEWSIVFAAHGAFIRVFDHESGMSPYANDDELWPGLLDGLPEEFRAQVEEPAFSDEGMGFMATAVLWRGAGDERWHAAEGIDFEGHDDGTGMLEILGDDIVARYVAFAEDYHEIEVDRAAVERVVAAA